MSFKPVKLIGPDIRLGAGVRLEIDIQQVLVRMQDGDGCRHLGQRIAVRPQRVQQTALRRQHVSGHRRLAGLQVEMGRNVGRHGGRNGHRTQLEARAEIERHRDLQGRLRRRSIDGRGQCRIVQLVAGDRRGDGRLVVAEAVQRGLEPVDVLARPFREREACHGCRFLQRDQGGTALQGGVERAVAGWFQVHRRTAADRPPANAWLERCGDQYR